MSSITKIVPLLQNLSLCNEKFPSLLTENATSIVQQDYIDILSSRNIFYVKTEHYGSLKLDQFNTQTLNIIKQIEISNG